jgi:putative flippase GtrA
LTLDISTLFVLHGLLGVNLAVATSIAYVTGLVSNYLVNRRLVFSSEGPHARSAMRYGLLVLFNYLATIIIVTIATSAGIPYLIGKFVAVGGTLIWNFLAYRHWVFTSASSGTRSTPGSRRA